MGAAIVAEKAPASEACTVLVETGGGLSPGSLPAGPLSAAVTLTLTVPFEGKPKPLAVIVLPASYVAGDDLSSLSWAEGVHAQAAAAVATSGASTMSALSTRRLKRLLTCLIRARNVPYAGCRLTERLCTRNSFR